MPPKTPIVAYLLFTLKSDNCRRKLIVETAGRGWGMLKNPRTIVYSLWPTSRFPRSSAQAFLDARGIDTTQCEDTFLDNVSFYGRIFAKSGGIAQGVAHVAGKLGVDGVNPCVMNGIDQCRQHLALLRAKKETANFFEGMACDGGCVGGPLSITRSPKNVFDVDKYGNSAAGKDIDGSVRLYQMTLQEEK